MIVSAQTLREYTGKTKASAQARFLRRKFPKIFLEFRDDGTIALRQEEFDRYTLSPAARATDKRKPTLDLSYLDRAS